MEMPKALRRQIVSKMTYLDMRRLLEERHHLTQDDVEGFSRLLRKYEQSHAEFVERRRKEKEENEASDKTPSAGERRKGKENDKASDKIPLDAFIEYVNSLKLDAEDKCHVFEHLSQISSRLQSQNSKPEKKT